MKRRINIGDSVICTESGVIGIVNKFYTPTASEEQTMVGTDDGRQYHAPTRCWVPLTIGMDLAKGTDVTVLSHNEKLLNKHGEYVLKFANNHGLTISEAHEHPMVKAHLVAFNAIQNSLRSVTD